MIKYKLLNHEHQWEGDAYLSDLPSDGYMPVIKKLSRAKSFFNTTEKEVEKVLKLWNLEYKKVGESQSPPRKKVK